MPDESTFLCFRHLLEKHDLAVAIFAEVNAVLSEKGLSMKRGTVVEATLIAAPSSTKNEDKQRDPEMRLTKKGNQWHFGMKAHIGVDADSGLIHAAGSVRSSPWPAWRSSKHDVQYACACGENDQTILWSG